MSDLWTTLRQRFPQSDPRVSDLAGAFNNINSFLPVISQWKQEAGRDKNLSPAGVSAAYRKKMGEHVMKEVRRVNALIAESNAKLDEARARVTQPKYDTNDALAAAHRREIREFLRSADASKRLSLLVGENADPIFVEAALELPAVVSGLPDDHAQMVRTVYAERHHADTLEHIQVREDALVVMNAFASAFKDEVRKQAGPLSVPAFDAWYENGTEPEAA